MKFTVKRSFAARGVRGSEGEVIDLPSDSEYARLFCEPLQDAEPADKPAPKPKAKKATK